MTIGRIPSVEGGIQPTIVDAKGDLIAGVAADSVNRLAVGSNDQVLVADSSTSTGLAWKSYGAQVVAGKNFIINGGFDIFQRSSFANQTSNAYSLDRWYVFIGGTVTASQQTTGVPAGSRYCIRLAYNANSSYANLAQGLEQDMASQLWGRTVTVSFKIRRSASFTGTITASLEKNSTANTVGNAGYSGIGNIVVTNAQMPTGTTSTDWYTASFQATVPNDGTANGIRLLFGESSVQSSGAYYEVSQVQLEVGSVATPFSRAGGTLQGELAACQRYYFRKITGALKSIGTGSYYASSIMYTMFDLPVEMRTTPTLDAASGTNYYRAAVNSTVDEFSGFQLDGVSTPTRIILITSSNISGTVGWSAMVYSESASAYVGVSAEL